MSVEIMSLEEMQQYQGTNPKPADFDSFWNKGISLVKEKNCNTELIPAGIKMNGAECFHLYFDGIDGARIHAKYLRPVGAVKKCPVVFLFHGYTGSSGDWWEKLAWIHQGFAVAAMDCRGQAGLSQDFGGTSGSTYLGHIVRGLLDAPENLLYYKIFLDTAMLVKAVRAFDEIDDTNMSVHGGSQGGGLSLVCAALNPDIKKAAVLYPFLSDYKRAWDLNCLNSAYEELRLFFRYHDPRHEHEAEFFTKLGYIDIQYLVPRIKADVLWATALKDQAVPASTQFAAYNHLTCNKKMLLYPEHDHENLPGYVDECFKFICEWSGSL